MSSHRMTEAQLREIRATCEILRTEPYGTALLNNVIVHVVDELDATTAERDTLRAEIEDLQLNIKGQKMFTDSERYSYRAGEAAGAELCKEIDALRAEAEELQSALETLVKLYGAAIMARNTL